MSVATQSVRARSKRGDTRTKMLLSAAEVMRERGAAGVDIDEAAARGAKVLLRQFVEFWERVLTDSDFNAGCPVVAAAVGSGDDEVRLAAECGRIFAHWRAALTRAFVADGFLESDADSLAVMSIAGLEGAVLLCRSLRSSDPLRKVHEQLEFLVKAREFVRRNGLPDGAATTS